MQGELEHRRVKRYYPRVHKGQYVKGIAKQTRRERILNVLANPTPLFSAKSKSASKKRKFAEFTARPGEANLGLPFSQNESLLPASADKPYQMSTEIRHKLDISCYLGEHEDDPALTVSFS